MDKIDAGMLDRLMKKRGEPCISLYLPTHRKGKEVEQNSIRFKNLLQETAKILNRKGHRDKEIRKLLMPCEKMLCDPFFWRHQDDGLVVFIAPAECLHFRLPIRFREITHVSRHFYIKPLMPILSQDRQFYILALDLKHVRFFRGSFFEISEMELAGVPVGLDDFLRLTDTERRLQFHTKTGGGPGRRGAIYHGHGDGSDDAEHKKSIARFFQQVDAAVTELIRDAKGYLVLAGVEYLLPLYREVSSLPCLIESGVTVNPGDLSREELHHRAWEVLMPIARREESRAIDQYRRSYGTGKASDDLGEILKAAETNKIEILFVRLGAEKWGTYYPGDETPIFCRQPGEKDEELLNLTAIKAYRQGAQVIVSDAAGMPSEAPIAAVFRY